MNYLKYKVPLLVSIALCLTLWGCTSGGSSSSDSDGSGSSNLQVTTRSLSARSDGDGRLRFDFSVASSAAAFQLLTFPEGNQIRLLNLRNDQGLVSLSALDSVHSSAVELQSQVNVLQVPFTPDNLIAGNYTAEYELIDPGTQMPLTDTEVGATLLTKQDADLSRGTVRVNLILVDPLGGSQELRESLEAALDEVRSIFSTVNLSLDVEWSAAAGSSVLPDPRGNDAFYLELTKAARPQSVNLVFGSQVSGLGSPNDQYAVSLRDGGVAVPNAQAVGVLGIFAVAGSDGRFNYDGEDGQQIVEDEIQLAAEEMAQLIAHFLGVSHLVENDGGNTTGSDSLSDTESCLTLTDCKTEKSIRENLMFPFPIFIDGTDMDSYKRTKLTAQQGSLLQRSVLVD